eukprot:COSAG06_NODE_844_length_11985_cov_4.119216_3_plen_86_part_00
MLWLVMKDGSLVCGKTSGSKKETKIKVKLHSILQASEHLSTVHVSSQNFSRSYFNPVHSSIHPSTLYRFLPFFLYSYVRFLFSKG